MTLDTLIQAANIFVLPGWLLLAFAPRWKYSARLIGAVILPGLLALAYGWLVATGWSRSQGDMDTVAGIQSFFQTPEILAAGWIHYLALDLFVGSWEVREAQRSGVPHWAVLPCLVLTLAFAPLGLVLFLLLRGAMTGSWALASPAEPPH